MAFLASENKNHSILLALRSLSLELVNEDAEKYRPNSITTPADYLNLGRSIPVDVRCTSPGGLMIMMRLSGISTAW